MSLNLATLLAESTKRHPGNRAVILGDTTLDYATLDAFARRFAGALKGLGLKPGQHIALLLPNVPHFTIAYFGGTTRRTRSCR
jgi:long-chain acyl-CoA synthetase